MAGKRRLIIPIFIPFGGCSHRCVYCDQAHLTGKTALPDEAEIDETIKTHLKTWKYGGRIEAAFYGGSFTALPDDLQTRYLGVARHYVERGKIHGLRISTRPDRLSPESVDFLKGFHVETIELGVQSMSDAVLRLSGRGHTVADNVKASLLLKGHGIVTGLQLMPGLPGDTEHGMLESARAVMELRPDFVRIYPAIVLKNTALHRMYLNGAYRPWPLEEMVNICKKISTLFKDAAIPIARMGLQHTAGLAEGLVAGPHHPCFRQLVDGKSPL